MSYLGDHILDVLSDSVDDVDSVDHVYKRNLWATCPSQTVLLQVLEWTPLEFCIGHTIGYPSRSRYLISLQTFVKHTDAETGRELSQNLAESVRVMLHTDAILHTALKELSYDFSGVLERISKWKVLRQSFFEDEQQGIFGFLSNTEIEFESYN